MEPFPFSDAEWDEVKAAALPVVNAGLAEDAVLRASAFVKFQAVMAHLRERHGDHPVLLETEADLSIDAADRHLLYQHALRMAVAHALPTFGIRLALADLLLREFRHADDARTELLACEEEVGLLGDASERERWKALLGDCDAAARES